MKIKSYINKNIENVIYEPVVMHDGSGPGIGVGNINGCGSSSRGGNSVIRFIKNGFVYHDIAVFNGCGAGKDYDDYIVLCGFGSGNGSEAISGYPLYEAHAYANGSDGFGFGGGYASGRGSRDGYGSGKRYSEDEI